MRFSFPRPSADSTQVILVRHGQSTYNAAGLFQGSSNRPRLSLKGILMSEAAGQYLGDSGAAVIFSSPLRRASDTAMRISRAQSARRVPVRFDPLLKEIHIPLWEGLPLAVVEREYTTDYLAWKDRPHLFRMGRRRLPVRELFESACEFWQTQLPRYVGRRILIVAHSGSCRALIATALGISPEYFHSLQSSNAGISLLEFEAPKCSSAKLHALNVTSYLGENLPKLKQGSSGLRLLLAPSIETRANDLSGLISLLDTLKPDLLVSAGANVDYHLSARLRDIRPAPPVEMWPARKLLSSPPCPVPEESLFTALVIAEQWLLRHLLANIAGLPPQSVSRFQLAASNLTSIHYSGPRTRPVLQAMNFAESNLTVITRETASCLNHAS